MLAHESKAEVTRLCGRRLAKCCEELERHDCPERFLSVTRRHLHQLKADLLGEIYTPSKNYRAGRK